MAFNPSSTIQLCSVPFDNTYQNQIYFADKQEQITYFASHHVMSFSNYLTVRKSLPDGSTQSSIKVDANIDKLYRCNYMVYQNENHGQRWFFAFITKLIYINEGTTEIVFETDVYQTWLFDVELKESYVVREHSETDNIGENIVPEKFSFQDYTYTEIEDFFSIFDISKYGYLIGSSDFVKVYEGDEDPGIGSLQSGVYQGLYFYYFPDVTGVKSFVENIENDCIQFITAIPTIVGNNSPWTPGLIADSKKPKEFTIWFEDVLQGVTFDGYNPKNNKMFTSPFTNLTITNHSGDEAIYSLEDFPSPKSFAFTMTMDISANPSVTLFPQNYKNLVNNPDFGISISGFPQCSCTSDSFKLWQAKNGMSVGVDVLSSLSTIALGSAAMLAPGGAIGGAAMITHGAIGVLNTVANVKAATYEPNKTKIGAPKNNLLTAMGKNTFQAYIRTIKADYARTVDSFFTMYGYQTNRVKTPNVSSRPYFNYIQTVDVNIVGIEYEKDKHLNIPMDDMRTLKAMYNNGVTLWKSTATVGDYSVDNSP